jgi:uncharacterized protein YukE
MAGKGYTRVDFTTMDAVEQDFNLTQRALKSELEALQKELEKLLDPADPVQGFTGVAGEAYETSRKQWQSAADDSHVWMARITTLLEEISGTYKVTERTTADLWHHG